MGVCGSMGVLMGSVHGSHWVCGAEGGGCVRVGCVWVGK